MSLSRKGGSGFGDPAPRKRTPRPLRGASHAFVQVSARSEQRRIETERLAEKLMRAGQLKEAERILRELERVAPASFVTLSHLGSICLMGGKFEEAIPFLRRALALDPSSEKVHSNLGIALRRLGALEEAIASFQQAQALDPDNPRWSLYVVNTMVEHGELEKAITLLRQILGKDPQHANAHVQLGKALLMQGHFLEGWGEYEWRWLCNTFPYKALLSKRPQWNLQEPCERLLLWGEQGVGDEIMYSTLVPEATKLVGHVLLQVDPRLVQPLQRALPECEVHPSDRALPEESFDRHLPMASLCPTLRPSEASFRRPQRSLLIPDQERSASLKSQLAATGKFNCGISWRSINPDMGHRKSIPLAQMAAALAHPAVQLISLQYGSVSGELAALREEAGIAVQEVTSVDPTGDLDGLAALIEACDLVISISNTTVHLAGAMGKTAWVLLHRVPDWCWGLHGETSLWYPSLRLFRQQLPEDWDEALRCVRSALLDLVADSAPADPPALSPS